MATMNSSVTMSAVNVMLIINTVTMMTTIKKHLRFEVLFCDRRRGPDYVQEGVLKQPRAQDHDAAALVHRFQYPGYENAQAQQTTLLKLHVYAKIITCHNHRRQHKNCFHMTTLTAQGM